MRKRGMNAEEYQISRNRREIDGLKNGLRQCRTMFYEDRTDFNLSSPVTVMMPVSSLYNGQMGLVKICAQAPGDFTINVQKGSRLIRAFSFSNLSSAKSVCAFAAVPMNSGITRLKIVLTAQTAVHVDFFSAAVEVVDV